MSKRDYYEILGVRKNASEDDIRKAYRKIAARYHPDRHATASEDDKKQLEEKFKEGKEAYEVLTDRQRRADYDQFGQQGEKIFQDFGVYQDIFRKAAEEKAARWAQISELKGRVQSAHENMLPFYERIQRARLVYVAFAEVMDKIQKDITSPHRSPVQIAGAVTERLDTLQHFANIYKEYKLATSSHNTQRDVKLSELKSQEIELQQIDALYGSTLRAFHKNIQDMAHGSVHRPEKVIIDRLSRQDTNIDDLLKNLSERKARGFALLSSTQRALNEDSEMRMALLRTMVEQYRQLAPLLIQKGYVGENYNPEGRSGDVEFAVSDLLRKIKHVPEEIRHLENEPVSVSFDPHSIFRNCSAFRARFNEAEVNSFLTPAQRKLVAWAQTQIDRFSRFDKILEADVDAALSPEELTTAQANFNNWKKYIERATKALPENNIHLKMFKSLNQLMNEGEDMASFNSNKFDMNFAYYAGHMDHDEVCGRFENAIQSASDFVKKAKNILSRDLLSKDTAISILRAIDPSITLNGVLRPEQGFGPQRHQDLN